MAKAPGAGFLTHLTQTTQSRANCWKITSRWGSPITTLLTTDWQSDLEIDGETYLSQAGFLGGASKFSDGGAIDTTDIEGIVDNSVAIANSTFTEVDVTAGKWDYAVVEFFQVVTTDSPITNKLWLKKGWLGEIEINDDHFTSELRGLTDILTQQFLSVYSPGCRYDFGSSRCTLNKANFTETGSVGAVGSPAVDMRLQINSSGITTTDDFFQYGELTFTSGLNNTFAREIKEQKGTLITFIASFPYAISVGDTFSVVQGCDFKHNTCKNTFDNVINFGGQPHLPGGDALSRSVTPKQPIVHQS